MRLSGLAPLPDTTPTHVADIPKKERQDLSDIPCIPYLQHACHNKQTLPQNFQRQSLNFNSKCSKSKSRFCTYQQRELPFWDMCLLVCKMKHTYIFLYYECEIDSRHDVSSSVPGTYQVLNKCSLIFSSTPTPLRSVTPQVLQKTNYQRIQFSSSRTRQASLTSLETPGTAKDVCKAIEYAYVYLRKQRKLPTV